MVVHLCVQNFKYNIKKVIKINYANIKYDDIANGPGVRVSLFVSGCRNKCKGCFQPETWNFDYGKPFTDTEKNDIIDYLRSRFVTGITILGGDPFEPENEPVVEKLLMDIKDIYPNKSVWVYTGYLYEDLIEKYPNIFWYIDVLVDGRFEEEKKDISLKFRGSSNQRIIDIVKSITMNRVVNYYND